MAQRRPTLHWVNLPEVGLCLVHQCLLQTSQLVEEIFWWKACLGRATSLGQSSSPGSPITLQKNHRWTWAWAIVLSDFPANSRRGWSLREGPGGTQSPRGPPLVWQDSSLCYCSTVILGGRAISQENYKSHFEETDTITPTAAVKCARSRRKRKLLPEPRNTVRPGSKYSRGPAWAHHVFLYAQTAFSVLIKHSCIDTLLGCSSNMICWHVSFVAFWG